MTFMFHTIMSGRKEEWKDYLELIIGILIVVILAALLLIGIAKYQRDGDEAKYNGGICTKCGGHYIYEQAVAHAYDTDYIYICDKCGDMIELESYRPQERKEE